MGTAVPMPPPAQGSYRSHRLTAQRLQVLTTSRTKSHFRERVHRDITAGGSPKEACGGAAECNGSHSKGGEALSGCPALTRHSQPAPCPRPGLSSAAPAAGPRRGLAARPSPAVAAAPCADGGSCCAAGALAAGPPTAV